MQFYWFQAKSLLHQPVSEEFRKEMKHNIDILGQQLNLQPPDAALFVIIIKNISITFKKQKKN